MRGSRQRRWVGEQHIVEPDWDDGADLAIERLADNVRNGRDLVSPMNWDESMKGMSDGSNVHGPHKPTANRTTAA